MKYLAAAIVCLSLGLFSTLNAQQQIQVGKIDAKIEYDVQQTPDFQVNGVKTKKVPNPKNWLEVEVEFKVEARPKEAIIPKIMLRYHIVIDGADGKAQLLSGDVNHVNVIANEEIFSVAYVSPAELGKITGEFRKFQPNAVKAVAVEIFYGGVLKGGASEGGPSGKWWESMSSQGGVLSKEKTPFAILWLDRYADVEQN